MLIWLRRRPVLTAVILAVSVLGTVVGGAQILGHLKAVGDRVDGVPGGYLSSLLWHERKLYFAREPLYASAGATELWSVGPEHRAARVPLAGGCDEGVIKDLAAGAEGRITLLWECDAASVVALLDPETGRTEEVARISHEPSRPVVNRVEWYGSQLLVSGDGYYCSAVGVVSGSHVDPIPALEVGGGLLDVGSTYRRLDSDCRELPMGGFVTRAGESVALLAAPSSAGVEPEGRGDVEWFVYRSDPQWKNVRRSVETLRRPTQLVALNDCSLLVSGEKSGLGIWATSGIWATPANGGDFSLVLRGEYADFAVEPVSGSLAVLGDEGKAEDLRMVVAEDAEDVGQVGGRC
ncbi:hypothetical protein [Micromonospora sp. NPDC006431]|uniref:hypothetical protein n=1 Tax=Micromonospora sp. NPDC006431 TaxID=3364235 RepID=UPI00367438B5